MTRYSREELLRLWKPYPLSAELAASLSSKGILASTPSAPQLLASNLEPLVNVNGGPSHAAGPRRRQQPLRRAEDATEEGEWHTVGEKKHSMTKRGEWDGGRSSKLGSLRKTDEVEAPVVVPKKRMQWMYVDPSGRKQGPFSSEQMAAWQQTGYLTADLPLAFYFDEPSAPLSFRPLAELFPAPVKPFIDAPRVSVVVAPTVASLSPKKAAWTTVTPSAKRGWTENQK